MQSFGVWEGKRNNIRLNVIYCQPEVIRLSFPADFFLCEVNHIFLCFILADRESDIVKYISGCALQRIHKEVLNVSGDLFGRR